MMTPDGVVKVLDFGLAKALSPGNDATAQAATFSSPAMTRAGIILGTAAYMSPEQARGRAVDARTDIWAFGCVLFEMLTGRRPFDGETVTDILGAIVHKEPDWSLLPATLPDSLRRLLERCLAKDQKQRLHNIADVRLEIQDLARAPALGGQSHSRRVNAARPARHDHARTSGVGAGPVSLAAAASAVCAAARCGLVDRLTSVRRCACRSFTPKAAKSACRRSRPTGGEWRIPRVAPTACR